MQTLTVMIRGRLVVSMPDGVDPTDWLRTAGNGMADLVPRALETGRAQALEKSWSPAKGVSIEINLTSTTPT